MDRDVVRRILSVHYRPDADSGGPSWLTLLGHTKDSLWSCDLLRCASATLTTHCVLVVMDQFTRRIVGSGAPRGIMDGVAGAGCSDERSTDKVPSAPIMIRCIDSIDGKPIFESLK